MLVLSWYGPGKMDAGERIRLGRITSAFERQFNVKRVYVVPDDSAEGDPSVVSPEEIQAPYIVRGVDYALSAIKLKAIESDVLGRRRALSRWVTEQIVDFRPDVIWANQPFAWSLIEPRWRRRAVLDTHNVNSARLARISRSAEVSLAGRAMARLQVPLTRRFERAYLGEAAAVVVVSHEDGALLRNSLVSGGSIVVIENGADLDESAPGFYVEPGEDPRLLFLGSLSYSANIAALQRLIFWLKGSSVKLRVTVAGSGDPGLARKLCAQDSRLEYVGRVEDARMEMRAHHGLIAPHDQGGGSRIKILEAIATRLPVIATRVAAEGIGLVDNRSYLEVADRVSLVAAVERLRDQEAARTIADQAWILAQEFQWGNLSRRAADVSANVVSRHRELSEIDE